LYSLFLFLEIETLLFVKIFLLFLFILLSGLVSGGEVAFFSLSPSYIKKITDSKSKSERIISDLRNNPRRLLAVILLMDNLFNIAAVLIFALDGKILWMVGLWMVIGSIVGAWLSSRWSVKKGDKVIRITLLIMVSYMAVKLWLDTFNT